MTFKVGIIGGSGLENPQILHNAREIAMETPFGKPSDVLVEGKIGGVPCVLLSRHIRRHEINLTNVNYRANLWALMKQGVTVIIASTACGSLVEEYEPGHIVFPDSIIDRFAHLLLIYKYSLGFNNSRDKPTGNKKKKLRLLASHDGIVMATFAANVEKAKQLFIHTVARVAKIDWTDNEEKTARESVMLPADVVIDIIFNG